MIPKILFWSGITLVVVNTVASVCPINYNPRKIEIVFPFLYLGGAAVAKYLGM